MKKILLFLAILSVIVAQAQDFYLIDKRVKSLPNKQYVSLSDLYRHLVLPSYNQNEKLRAITIWIVENIRYDVTYTHSDSTFATVVRRKGVCQDYAELFRDLCTLASIDCQVITGSARNHCADIGLDIASNHAWNVVSINGKYQLFDLTWATGTVDEAVFTKTFNNRYINADPKKFVIDHYPDDPKWQLLSNPISKNNFDNAPYLENNYFELNITNHQPARGVVFTDNFQLKFQCDREITSCTLFKWALHGYDETTGISLPIKKSGNEYSLAYKLDAPGAFRLKFYFNNNATLTYKVISSSYKVPKPTTWDLINPYSLIEPYLYVFYAMDSDLFMKLNQGRKIPPLYQTPHATDLNKGLSQWYGDFSQFYSYNDKNEVFIPIKGYEIVLKYEGGKYYFKQIKKV